MVSEEEVEFGGDTKVFAVEYLPGQYDQRADSAQQCIQILGAEEHPSVSCAKVYLLRGDLTGQEAVSYTHLDVYKRQSDLRVR